MMKTGEIIVQVMGLTKRERDFRPIRHEWAVLVLRFDGGTSLGGSESSRQIVSCD